jgi:hypothetical protein
VTFVSLLAYSVSDGEHRRMRASTLPSGMRTRTIELETDGPKRWRPVRETDWSRVEYAAFRFFQAEGCQGYSQEGGLMLSLIKAASFPLLPAGMHSHFIEALYYLASEEYLTSPEYQPPPPSLENPFDAEAMAANILESDEDRIRHNFAVMTAPGSSTLSFFPTLTLEGLLGLYRVLGNERLHAIAALFAQNPYRLRKGWPDLTLWRETEIIFREIKAPGDELRASQQYLIETILLPLNFTVELVNVVPAGLPALVTE